MTTSLSDIGYVGYGVETTEGTMVAPTFFLPASAFSIDSTVEPVIPSQIRGDRDMYVAMPGPYSVSGTFDMELTTSYVGSLLASALSAYGGVTSSAYAGGGYQHVFVPGNNSATYSFETSAADILFMRYGGIRVNTLEIRGAFGEIVTSTWGLEGTTRAKQGSGASEFYLTNTQYPLHFTGASVKINGSTVSNVKNFTFNVNNNIERIGTLRKTVAWSRTDLGKREIGLTMTMDFQNTTDYDLFLAGTEMAVQLHLEGNYISGSSGPRHTLVLDIPRAFYSAVNAPLNAGQLTEQSVTFQIMRQVGSNVVNATLINTESALTGV